MATVGRKHARLGPSSSDIWLTCLGAPAEWAKRPPKRVGLAAHEGTLAHALCEGALELNAIPWTAGMSFDVEGDQITVTGEMLDAVRLFSSVVQTLSDTVSWRIFENNVSLAWVWTAFGEEPPENVFGTLDFAACDGHTLYVIDFKFGRGKAVNPERNTQLLLYALGVYDRLRRERPDLAASIEDVCLAIIQPRAGGAPVRTWTISLGDLLYWGFAAFKPSVEKIANGSANVLTPGGHCFFCPASFDCPAYLKVRNERSIASFPVYDPDQDGDIP